MPHPYTYLHDIITQPSTKKKMDLHEFKNSQLRADPAYGSVYGPCFFEPAIDKFRTFINNTLDVS